MEWIFVDLPNSLDEDEDDDDEDDADASCRGNSTAVELRRAPAHTRAPFY